MDEFRNSILHAYRQFNNSIKCIEWEKKMMIILNFKLKHSMHLNPLHAISDGSQEENFFNANLMQSVSQFEHKISLFWWKT